MNLKNKYFLWSSILMTMVIMLGSFSIWNLTGLWRASRLVAMEYNAMDLADAASVQVAWLRDSLRGPDAATYRDAKYLVPIRTQIREITRELRLASSMDDGDSTAESNLAQSAADHFDSAANLAGGSASGAAGELDLVRQSLLGVSHLVPGAARHHITAVADRLHVRLEWSCVLLLVALAVSLSIHYRQYRALVRPLLWLREEMRRSAARNYQEEVRLSGDREFRDVALFFNGLAHELAELYRNLEQKVITRSRELVRSERLASVGFLAAGVAHEINNPLSVISGYAELAAKSLQRMLLGPAIGNQDGSEQEAEALGTVLEAQEIIHEEAFRCKEITSRLLSLARGGDAGRQLLSMDDVARQVSVLTKGLKNYRDRRVILEFKNSEPLQVVANLTEMKQVLLNLTVNALEAVPAERGEVRIGGRRAGEWVELSIEDNGKGMTPETLEHVFEPFFTAKRGAGEPGTGLGLSITHAIVENHGGRIRAESRGPGHGSRFTVRLPANIQTPVDRNAVAIA